MKETLELELISDDVPQEKIKKGSLLYYALVERPLDYTYLGSIMESKQSWLKIDTLLFDSSISYSKVGPGITIFTSKKDESSLSLPLSKAKITKRYFRQVNKDDWRVDQLITPEREQDIDFELIISEEQKAFFEYGMYPLSMDHKWFMYCENHEFHFLRSWTGIEFFKGKFVKTGEEQWKISKIKTDKNWGLDKDQKSSLIKDMIEWRIRCVEEIMR